MEIEQRKTSYLIFFQQGKKVQKTPVVGVSHKTELVNLVLKTFKGRFKCPAALNYNDGVRIVIKCLDHINHQSTQVFRSRIFNKSVTQARQMLELAIKNQ